MNIFISYSTCRIPVCTHVTWLAAFALAMTAYLSDGDARWLSLTLFLSLVVLTLSVMLTASQSSTLLAHVGV